MKKQLKLPKFKNIADEQKFWDEINLGDYADPGDLKRVSFPNLKPSSKSITLRLPVSLLDKIKTEAHKRDVPYQSYIKVKLNEIFSFPT